MGLTHGQKVPYTIWSNNEYHFEIRGKNLRDRISFKYDGNGEISEMIIKPAPLPEPKRIKFKMTKVFRAKLTGPNTFVDVPAEKSGSIHGTASYLGIKVRTVKQRGGTIAVMRIG